MVRQQRRLVIPFSFWAHEGAAADKITLIQFHTEIESSLKGGIFRRDIPAPVAVPLFKAQGIDGPVTDIGEAEGFSRLPEEIVDISGILHRHMEFPPQFTHIGDPEGQDRGIPDEDFFTGHVGKALIGDVVLGDLFQNVP